MRRKDAAAPQGSARGRLMVRPIANLEKLAEAQQAADAALEAAQFAAAKVAEAMAVVAPGTKPPADVRVVTSLWLPPELMLGLKSLAVRKRKTVNDVIVEVIKNHLLSRPPL
jgi:hypothetical protein